MGKLPSKECLLATLFSFKLCVCYVIFAESLALFLTNSPLINVTVRGLDYAIVVVLFMVMAAMILIFETILMLSMYTNHFNFTKRLNIADIWIQLIFFLPTLIGLIIFGSLHSTVEPHWKTSFEYLVNDSAINDVQQQGLCCGYNYPNEWKEEGNTFGYDDNSTWFYPHSCCHKNNCTTKGTNDTLKYAEHRVFDIGCFPQTENFVHRYTLGVSILLLIFTIISFPRNLWQYRFVEMQRRRERRQRCAHFISELRAENDTANRKCGVKPLHQIPLAGIDSEKENMLTSEDTQMASTETTSVTKHKNKKVNVSSTTFNVLPESQQQQQQSGINDGGGSSSKRMEAGRCANFEPESIISFEFDEVTSDGSYI